MPHVQTEATSVLLVHYLINNKLVYWKAASAVLETAAAAEWKKDNHATRNVIVKLRFFLQEMLYFICIKTNHRNHLNYLLNQAIIVTRWLVGKLGTTESIEYWLQ